MTGALCEPKPVQRPHPPIWVGGSGERITLKLVAQYGDACNVFEDTSIVAHRMERLREHCKNVGRDYDAITKTSLRHVVISEDESAVGAIVAGDKEPGESDEELRSFTTYGTPDLVSEEIQKYIESGIQYLIVNFDSRHEEEMMSLFADKVMLRFNKSQVKFRESVYVW